MKIEFTVQAESKVDLSEVVSQFSDMNSDQQAVVLHELFDALEFKCKEKFQSRLSWIGIGIQRHNLKRLEYVFESLLYFMKKENEHE